MVYGVKNIMPRRTFIQILLNGLLGLIIFFTPFPSLIKKFKHQKEAYFYRKTN